MAKAKKSFKSELHLGLLVIIMILMLLNVVSNFIIYKARNANLDAEAINFANAGLALSRNLEGQLPVQLEDAAVGKLLEKYHLKDIVIIPSLPSDEAELSRRSWFQGIIGQISPNRLNEVAGKILKGEFRSVKRGEKFEFYYLYPFKSKSGRALLIMSAENAELAFLEESSNLIFYISIFVVIAIIGVYSWLYKSILAPFRKIKDEVVSAGREVGTEDEVETTIEEYHRIIADLKEKEAELLVLNDAITRKADSLENYNQYLLRSMISGLISLDNNGVILSINESIETMFRVDSHELTGKNISDLGFVSEELLGQIKEAINSQQSKPYREYQLDCGENCKYVGISISAVTSESTANLGVSILINDITELKQLRQELERSNRLAALGEMAAGLAHQIRNSLGAVLGYGTLLKKKLSKNELDTNPAESLMAETRDAEQLISKFLNITKPMEYHPEPVKLRLFVEDVIDNWKIQQQDSKIEMVWKVDEVEAYFDPLLMKQVLNNLINNACDAYGEREGKLDIFCTIQNNQLEISVTDEAGGIPVENIEKIFTPFYSTRASGTGLGLPLVKKIVELHHGFINVEPNGANGTSFKISLPLTIESNSSQPIKIQK